MSCGRKWHLGFLPTLAATLIIGAFLCYNSNVSDSTEKMKLLPSSSVRTKRIPPEQLSMAKHHPEENYGLAYSESMGFFDDIPNESWRMMKEYVKDWDNEHENEDPMKFAEYPNRWYQYNWEPNFSCTNERRVGSGGTGARWVCNPHRIPEIAKGREEEGGEKCLIYSVGIAGDFEFENGIQELVGLDTCEIHIFGDQDDLENKPKNAHIHPWGLAANDDKLPLDTNLKSLKETVEQLGHKGRIVDIFKVDCEECEWHTYQDWFYSGLDIRQVLVETHLVNENTNDFFEELRDEGFVIFHKEPNTISTGNITDFSFLKLSEIFFD